MSPAGATHVRLAEVRRRTLAVAASWNARTIRCMASPKGLGIPHKTCTTAAAKHTACRSNTPGENPPDDGEWPEYRTCCFRQPLKPGRPSLHRLVWIGTGPLTASERLPARRGHLWFDSHRRAAWTSPSGYAERTSVLFIKTRTEKFSKCRQARRRHPHFLTIAGNRRPGPSVFHCCR